MEPNNTNQNDSLDMIVWLKGDEPYFGDFSLSADEVMASLSIKRSRLNQISGKELRVGRARIDRYYRPVYRPTDVEAYLNWTRPTASHQRSTSVLNEAAKKLHSSVASIPEDIEERFIKISKTLLNQSKDQLTSMHRNNTNHNSLVKKDVARIQDHVGDLASELRKIETNLSNANQMHFKNVIVAIERLIQHTNQQNEEAQKNSATQNEILLQLQATQMQNSQIIAMLNDNKLPQMPMRQNLSYKKRIARKAEKAQKHQSQEETSQNDLKPLSRQAFKRLNHPNK